MTADVRLRTRMMCTSRTLYLGGLAPGSCATPHGQGSNTDPHRTGPHGPDRRDRTGPHGGMYLGHKFES